MTRTNDIRDLFVALGAGVLVSVVLLFCTSAEPLRAAASFFGGPFSSMYFAGSWFDKAALLTLAASGMCVSFHSGNFNLGGEGQIYAGGLTAALVLNSLQDLNGTFPALGLFIAFVASATISGLCGFISGKLKALRGTNELLTSFLISSALIPFIDYAISGPLRGKSGTLLATPFIPENMRLFHFLPPSSCNISILFAVASCFLCWFFIFRTRRGYELRLCGKAPQFARYCGFPLGKTDAASLFVSAAMHGATGFFAVAGTFYTCHSGFYSGMGWNALSVALMAKSNPLAVIPAGLLFSYLLTATDQAVLTGTMKFDSAYLVQAAVLLTVSAQFIRQTKERR